MYKSTLELETCEATDALIDALVCGVYKAVSCDIAVLQGLRNKNIANVSRRLLKSTPGCELPGNTLNLVAFCL